MSTNDEIRKALQRAKDYILDAGDDRTMAPEVESLDNALANLAPHPAQQGDDGEKVTWYIPHPGTLEKTPCESFEQAMKKWYEGFNLPVRCVNGKPEDFKLSYNRVELYHAEFAARSHSKQEGEA